MYASRCVREDRGSSEGAGKPGPRWLTLSCRRKPSNPCRREWWMKTSKLLPGSPQREPENWKPHRTSFPDSTRGRGCVWCPSVKSDSEAQTVAFTRSPLGPGYTARLHFPTCLAAGRGHVTRGRPWDYGCYLCPSVFKSQRTWGHPLGSGDVGPPVRGLPGHPDNSGTWGWQHRRLEGTWPPSTTWRGVPG